MSKHGLEEGSAVKPGSVAQTVGQALRDLAHDVMSPDSCPLACLMVIGVFAEDGHFQSMPTLATVNADALPTLVKTLRTIADNIEAGDRGRERIPTTTELS